MSFMCLSGFLITDICVCLLSTRLLCLGYVSIHTLSILTTVYCIGRVDNSVAVTIYLSLFASQGLKAKRNVLVSFNKEPFHVHPLDLLYLWEDIVVNCTVGETDNGWERVLKDIQSAIYSCKVESWVNFPEQLLSMFCCNGWELITWPSTKIVYHLSNNCVFKHL